MTELNICSTNFFPELCGVNVIVDPQTELGADDDRILIIGQKGNTGTAPDNSLQRVTEATRGDLFEAGSMLNRMIDEAISISPTAEIWAFVLPNTGTIGSSEITVTGVLAGNPAGSVYLWVNGQLYQAAYDPTVDTDDTLAARIAALVNSDPALTATVAANVVTIDTNAAGEIGGFLDVRTGYSRRPDLVSSPDITLAVVDTASTGLPDLSALATVTDGFEFVISPYTDDVSVGHLSTYLCSQWSGGANSRGYGFFYGDEAAAIARGTNTNDALISFLSVDGALTPSYLESAAYGALAFNQMNCQSEQIAMSMTGQALPAMLAPEQVDVYTDAEKANLVESGMGYVNVNRVNDVIIGRAVTTFTVRDNGSLDASLRDVNKPSVIACVSRFFREELFSKYSGYAFRNDGIVGNNSTQVATIASVRSYIISLAQQLSNRNLIENLQGFVASLTVEVNADGCIEITSEPELVCPFCCINVVVRTN